MVSRWLVVRAWLVEAGTGAEAVENARPGGHRDVRALLTAGQPPAVRLAFSTTGEPEAGTAPPGGEEALRDLRERLDNARHKLAELEASTPSSAFERKARLAGKREGVDLAISYILDALG